ncbi:MAG: response regulator [Deltaproteobacteria bacterium]|nr:response regulator [Deltaproteobacteria bacterium]
MGRNYLLVDDNRAFAENVAEIVRDFGDEVAVADSGPRALELARLRRFQAVITDMRMPLMGGAELVREIRKIDPGVAAIVVTAHVADAELQAARREGLLAVLGKPVPIHPLLDLLGAARRDGLVAVVEDDLDLSENICEVMRGRGFSAVTAATVLETDWPGAARPFAGLVDLRVPGGPAGEAMLRLGARFPGLPLVVMSGYDDPAPAPCAVRLTKPFPSAVLLEALERFHAAATPTLAPRP